MHSFHLLLVDDHENILFTFRLALEMDGYDVDTAATVAEARAKIERNFYDLLILDLRLGTESGVELLASLRAENIQTPVLMMTAHGTTQAAVAAMKLGAVDFLAKPLEPTQFRATVAETLRRRLPSRGSAAEPDRETCKEQILEAKHAINCRDFRTARLHLARALELNSFSADAHYLFGSILELTENPEKARRYYQRALQLYAERSLATASLPPDFRPGSVKRN